MELLTVNKEKCLRCGLCVQACPACILNLGAEGPECHFDRGCMGCGHCVAVCPVGALDNKYTPLEKMQPLSQSQMLTSEAAYHFLRSRRSVRCFKPQPPDDETLLRLLDICRYAPTASNSQGMYYIVIRDPEEIRGITETVVEWMEQEVAAGTPNKRYFSVVLRAYRERGQDIIARHAPCLIFALAKRLNISGESNAEQCFAYAMLYAPTLGLGTTYAGFLSACALSGYEPLIQRLRIPPKHKVVGALMAGYPKIRFRRMPERQHLKAELR